MVHYYCVEWDNVRLRPLMREDIESLRQCRNNQKAVRFLRKIGHISTEMQEQWFLHYQENPNEIIFAIEETQDLRKLIGSVSLYDIDWQQSACSIGKIQIGDDAAHGRGIGRKALVMSMKIGFRFLALKKITASVHRENISAHSNDMKVGFQIVGECASEVGDIEDLIEITEENVTKANPGYYKIQTSVLNRMSPYVTIGSEGSFSKTISESDIYTFAGITGDFNPIHVNKVEADKCIFKKQVAHGHLISALFSTVIGTKMPGPGTICLRQESRFLKPVYLGDTITSHVWVTELKNHNRALLKMISCNQADEPVVSGDALVLLPPQICVFTDKICGGGGNFWKLIFSFPVNIIRSYCLFPMRSVHGGNCHV